MARPSTLPRFADSAPAGNVTEPLEGRKDVGFDIGSLAPSQWFNWLFKTIYTWLNWLAADAATLDEAQTFTATKKFNGPGVDDQPLMGSDTVPTNRQLLFGPICGFRLYYTADGAFEVTINAGWIASGGNANTWSKDVAEVNGAKYRFDANGLRSYSYTSGGGHWADSAWSAQKALDAGTYTTALPFGVNAGLSGGGSTMYLVAGGSGVEHAGSSDGCWIAPCAGRVAWLHVEASPTTTGGGHDVFTVHKAGADQAVTVDLSAGATSGDDNTHSFTVAAGDKIGVKSVRGTGPTATTVVALVWFKPE
jgi:co-chaperonin GroES (HSP10)